MAAGDCKTCMHPNLIAINTALAQGHPTLRTVADQNGLSKTGLLRHRDKCLQVQPVPRSAIQQAKKAAQLPEQMRVALVDRVRAAAEDQNRTARLGQQALYQALGLDQNGNGFVRIDGDYKLSELAELLSAVNTAQGGSTRQWLETEGKVTGELASGKGVQIVVNVGGKPRLAPEVQEFVDTTTDRFLDVVRDVFGDDPRVAEVYARLEGVVTVGGE